MALATNFCSVLHAVWHVCVTLHLTSISDVPDRMLHWALTLRGACVVNRFARVLVPCAAQQGDPTSAGVNQGELRRRFTACGRHDSGPPHCPTVSPPHRRKPRALCDRSPRSLRSSWRRSCESRQSVGRWYLSVAAYHSARALFCQLSSQESQALIGSGQGAWDL